MMSTNELTTSSRASLYYDNPLAGTKSKFELLLHRNNYYNQKWVHLMEPDENVPYGKKLSIHGKDLKDLDLSLFKIDLFLTKLELSPDYQSCIYYKLTKLPGSIGNLKHLRELKLDTNDLHYLPAEMGSLENLERLSLSNNSLKSLPDSLVNLKKLTSLHMSKNQFESIPLCISQMTALVYLDMTTNKLRSIDPCIKSIRGTLKFLSFYDNQLSVLPSWLEEMTNLEQLWLGCNQIKSIPYVMTNMRTLDWGENNYLTIILDNNPLEQPPITVCRKGFKAIKNWYIDKNLI